VTDFALVRHGETDWNLARRIQGRTDIPLNETGRAQATATGRSLAAEPWDLVVASPLDRAAETARLVAAELGLGAPLLDERFVERDYGAAEGMEWHEVERRWPDGDVPGREPRERVAERVIPALVELAAARPGARIVVVSHGGAIRSALETVSPDEAHGVIRNGSVHRFRHDDAGLALVAFDAV